MKTKNLKIKTMLLLTVATSLTAGAVVNSNSYVVKAEVIDEDAKEAAREIFVDIEKILNSLETKTEGQAKHKQDLESKLQELKLKLDTLDYSEMDDYDATLDGLFNESNALKTEIENYVAPTPEQEKPTPEPEKPTPDTPNDEEKPENKKTISEILATLDGDELNLNTLNLSIAKESGDLILGKEKDTEPEKTGDEEKPNDGKIVEENSNATIETQSNLPTKEVKQNVDIAQADNETNQQTETKVVNNEVKEENKEEIQKMPKTSIAMFSPYMLAIAALGVEYSRRKRK